MQVTYRGLALEQMRDRLFDTLVRDTWYVLHQGSGRTVMTLTCAARRAEEITTALARLRDWKNISEWEGDVGLAAFVARYPGEAQLPRPVAGISQAWDDDVPYGDDEESVPRNFRP